ncbi:MAG: prepilin-type N-terminal cleavage/methylation domain-containing protein [Candidatus Moraniibacteriota bacterium]
MLKNKKNGFTLIEMMVFLFIFVVSVLTFYKVFTVGTFAMADARSRTGGVQLANERIEIIHNLKYEDIGTVGGVVAGDLLQNETVVRSGRTYYAHTSVMYLDDAFDGTALAGTDTRSSDYKQVKVIVYWENGNLAKSTTAVAHISPPGLEAIYTGGILSLNVIDSAGIGVPSASIRIINNDISPVVDTTHTTNSSGNLFLAGAKPAGQTYKLQVSKSGYFAVQTLAPFPTSSFNPIDIHSNVVVATINQKTIILDKLANLNIFTKTPAGEVVPSIDFALEGGRRIGDTVAIPSMPVWSLTQANYNSATTGRVEFLNVSPGSYFLDYLISAQNNNYQFLYFDVAGAEADMFDLAPGTTLNATAIVADKAVQSLVVTVLNDADSVPIVGASVQLKNADESYKVTLITNKFGKVYFPDSSASLLGGAYRLNVTASGFEDVLNKDTMVNKLTSESVMLIAE